MKKNKYTTDEETLSEEWIKLVEYAMNSGVTKQEFKKFLDEKEKEYDNRR